MAKAEQAYHKRDLYSDVTARILAELQTGAQAKANATSNHGGATAERSGRAIDGDWATVQCQPFDNF